MLRNLVVAIAFALLLQPGAVEARGHGGASHSRRSSSSYGTSHRTRSSSTRSHGTRSHTSRSKRDPAERRAFMRSHPCPSTGRTSGACPGYVVDHVVPLKRGGADRPANMQWQTVAAGKAKDKWE